MAKRRSANELKSNHALYAGVVASLIAALAVAAFRTGRLFPELEALERRTLDLRFTLRGPIPVGSETVIVAYDDKTHAEDPTLYEKRAGWAQLINALASSGAKVIGVDAFFTEAETILPPDLARDIDGYLHREPTGGPRSDGDALLERVYAETTGDAQLAAAIKQANNVVLGVHMSQTRRPDDKPIDPSVSRSKYGQAVPGAWQPRPVYGVIASLPLFNRAARALGMMTVVEDDTQSVRVLPLVRALGDSFVAPLAVQALGQWTGEGRSRLAYLGNEHEVRIGDRAVPLADDDGILLNFRGPAQSFPTYSAVDVVRGTVGRAQLDGKIVLVGFTHLGHDRTRTAFGPGQPGVEMHATAIDNLLRRDWLQRATWWQDVAASAGLALAIALLFWAPLGLRAYSQALLGAALLATYLGVTYWLFAHRGAWWSWLGPSFSAALVAAIALTVAYAREGLQRRRIRHAFGHYLAAGVIEELLANPDALALGGERRNLSVLFSDIRGFTSFSEKLDPEQLVKILNTYLTPMTRAVLQSGGFLDKFIGDAVMAVFGAPIPDERHPQQALDCALRMAEELTRIRPVLAEMGVPIEIGVGINSGEMAVGNLGSDEHFNYTVMGDAVNLASRLEALTRTYGVFCVVGEETQKAAGAAFRFRAIDLVRVKGKEQPVAIFELLGDASGARSVATYDGVERFAAAMAAYRTGDFAAARAAFAAFAKDNAHCTVTPIYLARLEAAGESAPVGWDGVTVHSSK